MPLTWTFTALWPVEMSPLLFWPISTDRLSPGWGGEWMARSESLDVDRVVDVPCQKLKHGDGRRLQPARGLNCQAVRWYSLITPPSARWRIGPLSALRRRSAGQSRWLLVVDERVPHGLCGGTSKAVRNAFRHVSRSCGLSVVYAETM